MSRKQHSLSEQLVVAAALALGTSGVALADDSSMNMWTGDSYAKLDLKQDLGGLDLAVATEAPSDSPSAIAITNNSAVAAACTLTYTGADAGPASTVTIRPGKVGTMRVVVDASNFVRSGNLKCVEKKVASSALAKRE